MDPRVDQYILKNKERSEVLSLLRSIALEQEELQETIKWGIPCYTYGKELVLGLAAFKNFTSIWFYQGVFLEDKAGVLINAQKGKTKALRQWRLYPGDEIDIEQLGKYIEEATHNAKSGKKLKVERNALLDLPMILSQELNEDSALKNKFDAFSTSKKNEFISYIQEAKRDATKQSRLIKILSLIRSGKSLHDQYRK